MRIFDQISKRYFSLSRANWTEDQVFSAECIGLQRRDDNTFICDIRKTWPEAVSEFVKYAFPELHERTQYKAAMMGIIREMYTTWFNRVRNQYKPLIDYSHVGKQFRKHQYAATWRMIPNRVNFLSFDMGLGKTITSANLSNVLDVDRTVIIAPAGVKWNWFHDLVDEWGFDSANFTILDARKEKCREAFIEKFLIINYENIDKYWEYLIEGRRGPVGHIIIDEVHNCKNHNTRRYKSVKRLIDHYPEARVTMLTGTPITNRINDLFAYFKMANHPLGANHTAFMRRYVKKSDDTRFQKITGAQKLDELRMRYSNFIIRKRTEECIDLPDLIIKKCYLDEDGMTQEYKDALKAIYEHKAAQEADGDSVGELETSFSTSVHTLNRILATAKTKPVIKDIDELWKQGKKVLVFSTYKSALSALERHYGLKCVKIDGSVGAHKRSLLIDKFKKDPNCHVFLGNVKAAGVGINLVNCSDVMFLNFPFTPDDLEQPQKRSHRMGQKHNVLVRYYMVKNSIDEHIHGLIVDKSSDINELLDKDKPGTINYSRLNIMESVYNKLINQYAEEHNLPALEGTQFKEV